MREVVEVTARCYHLRPTAEWVDGVVAGCERLAPDHNTRIDYLEREFEAYDGERDPPQPT